MQFEIALLIPEKEIRVLEDYAVQRDLTHGERWAQTGAPESVTSRRPTLRICFWRMAQVDLLWKQVLIFSKSSLQHLFLHLMPPIPIYLRHL